jgi:hypothetical protein
MSRGHRPSHGRSPGTGGSHLSSTEDFDNNRGDLERRGSDNFADSTARRGSAATCTEKVIHGEADGQQSQRPGGLRIRRYGQVIAFLLSPSWP